MANKKEPYNHNLNHPEEVGTELSKIDKKNNFQVPENYFEELPQIIQEKVIGPNRGFELQNLFGYFFKPYKLVALASLIVIFLVGIFFINNQNGKDTEIVVEVSFEDLIDEFPEMIEYMDDQVLFELAAIQMEEQNLVWVDYEFGFDSISLQNEIYQHLSDEEVSEIIFNL